jgi:hypothetical protein
MQASGAGVDDNESTESPSVAATLLSLSGPQSKRQEVSLPSNVASTASRPERQMGSTEQALQHHYEVPKQEALDTLKEFLEAPEVIALGVAQTGLAEAKLGRANPGFVDRLIHADYLASTAGMVSFEKAARKLPNTHVPA